MLTLLNYQQKGVHDIRAAFRRVSAVLYVLSTGGGKTVLFTYIAKQMGIKNKAAAILVHRIELLRQTSRALEKFDVQHGLINPQFTQNYDNKIQVASVQTAMNRLNYMLAARWFADLIIIDECFPAGTLINGVEIQNLSPHDLVDSFNHDQFIIEQKRVVGLMERQYDGDWYKITTSTGKTVICTENHPFFTLEYGYVNAKLLPLFNDLTLIENERVTNIELHELRERLLLRKEGRAYASDSQRPGVLLGSMYEGDREQGKFRKDDANEFTSPGYYFRTDEEKQSYVQPGDLRENESLYEGEEIRESGRKWKVDTTTIAFAGSDGAEIRTCHRNRSGKTILSPDSAQLQTGFGGRGIEISDRSGRKITSSASHGRTGQKENGSFEFSRLGSVEIYKRTSGQRPDWVPGNDTVYNIEVEANHNYFANGILVHNCHHATSPTYRKIIDHFKAHHPDMRILGVTATPIRTDGQGLGTAHGGIFDEIVSGPSMQWLMDEGYLVRAKVLSPPKKFDSSKLKRSKGDFKKDDLDRLINKPTITGDAVEHYEQVCNGAPTIVFCVSVDHTKQVAAEFQAHGYKFYAIDGSTDDDERAAILGGLVDGSVQGVCSCDLINEGTDVPRATCAIMLRLTGSLGLYLQQVGRILRPACNVYACATREERLALIAASEKPFAYLLDHVGNVGSWVDGEFVENHGLPDKVHEWSLDGEVKKKKKRASEEAPVRIMQCRSCFMVFEPAPVCPACGHEVEIKDRKPKKVEGQLKEVTAEMIAAAELKKNQRMEVGQVKTYEDLVKIQKERDYKPGWVHQQMKLRNIKKPDPAETVEFEEIETEADELTIHPFAGNFDF